MIQGLDRRLLAAVALLLAFGIATGVTALTVNGWYSPQPRKDGPPKNATRTNWPGRRTG